MLKKALNFKCQIFRTLKEYVNPPYASAVEAHPPPAESESIDYLIMGHVMATVPIRDRASKWYLPAKFYPLNIFPR